jgi:alginate O-acetyltransferase complex protein AlgI
MGIDLMTNFQRPYLSKSIQEFWRRWHISLSTWFRDYLYIPLGGSRVAKWRWQYNLFITFLISGLWHGANWTFVIWGALHGFYMIFAIWTAKIREKINSFIFGKKEYLFKVSQIITTIFLAWFAWIFFRASSFGEAILIIKRIFIPSAGDLNLFSNKADFSLALFLIGLLSVVEILEERIQLYSLLKKQIKPIKWIILLFILFAIIVLGKWESIDFLYFQF